MIFENVDMLYKICWEYNLSFCNILSLSRTNSNIRNNLMSLKLMNPMKYAEKYICNAICKQYDMDNVNYFNNLSRIIKKNDLKKLGDDLEVLRDIWPDSFTEEGIYDIISNSTNDDWICLYNSKHKKCDVHKLFDNKIYVECTNKLLGGDRLLKENVLMLRYLDPMMFLKSKIINVDMEYIFYLMCKPVYFFLDDIIDEISYLIMYNSYQLHLTYKNRTLNNIAILHLFSEMLDHQNVDYDDINVLDTAFLDSYLLWEKLQEINTFMRKYDHETKVFYKRFCDKL